MGFQPIGSKNLSDGWPGPISGGTHSFQRRRSTGKSVLQRSRVTVLDRARKVRLLCVDVDGVLTDAGMYYGPDGEVLKKFNTRDGMGLARVREAGVAVAIISGEDSAIVHARAAKLKIDDVFCNASKKRIAVDQLCTKHALALDEVAYV